MNRTVSHYHLNCNITRSNTHIFSHCDSRGMADCFLWGYVFSVATNAVTGCCCSPDKKFNSKPNQMFALRQKKRDSPQSSKPNTAAREIVTSLTAADISLFHASFRERLEHCTLQAKISKNCVGFNKLVLQYCICLFY